MEKLVAAAAPPVTACLPAAAEGAGVREGLTTAAIAPSATLTCNETILDFLQSRPDLSTLLTHLETAGKQAAGPGSWLPLAMHGAHACGCTATAARRLEWGQQACSARLAPPPASPRLPACPPPLRAGVAPLLNDSAATITLFAPTNDAWAQVQAGLVDLRDIEVLQQVLTFLVAQGGLHVSWSGRQGGRAGCRESHAMPSASAAAQGAWCFGGERQGRHAAPTHARPEH